jgi:hypothetical protein
MVVIGTIDVLWRVIIRISITLECHHCLRRWFHMRKSNLHRMEIVTFFALFAQNVTAPQVSVGGSSKWRVEIPYTLSGNNRQMKIHTGQ